MIYYVEKIIIYFALRNNQINFFLLSIKMKKAFIFNLICIKKNYYVIKFFFIFM